jgi:hypothetical protein
MPPSSARMPAERQFPTTRHLPAAGNLQLTRGTSTPPVCRLFPLLCVFISSAPSVTAVAVSSRADHDPENPPGMDFSYVRILDPIAESLPNTLRWRPYVINDPSRARNFSRVSINNQGAFDTALLHLLNQGHRSVSASGRSQLRTPRGEKSAIGALIPDGLYQKSMEGKTVQQLLAAAGPDYEPLREHFSGVTLPLLNELQDLHDRTGACLPSLFREIVLAGGQRIARMFGLSARMLQLWSIYRKVAGPRVPQRTAPVVVESAGGGASRYSRGVGVSAVI